MADYESDPEEYDADEDLDDDDYDECAEPPVQLGYLADVDADVDAATSDAAPDGACAAHLARRYFPSKLGGRPAWLEPVRVPPVERLTCNVCQAPMRFLLQVPPVLTVCCSRFTSIARNTHCH